MSSILKVDTLQDSGGNTILSSDGAGTFTSSLPNTGITMADQWRLTANKTDNTDITANLERVDDAGFGGIGTGMTESSGIFTFPQTGIYLVSVNIRFEIVANDNATVETKATQDNSTYDTMANAIDSGDGSSSGAGQGATQILFDVTDTSTHKVKFTAGSLSSGSYLVGSSVQNDTAFTFIRLGDT